MSTRKRNSFVIGAMIILGLGLATPAAHAFNPQPDPPAKSLKTNSIDTLSTSSRNTLTTSPGLLESGIGASGHGHSAHGSHLGSGPAISRGAR